MNTTVRMKASQIYKDWHVIDAAGRPLGRVATEAATLLRGKHKPTFEPHLDAGDFVIIVNASKVRVSGGKESQIRYYRHSGYPGGLKSRSFTEQMDRFPDRVLEQAVWGMLPDGPLGKKMLKHLKVYAGPNHPHASQIAFTEKAQAARVEATQALTTKEPKAPRLRPLSVATPSRNGDAALADSTTRSAPKPAAKAPPRRGKAPKATAEATVAAELEAAADSVLTSETPPPAAATLNDDVVVAENATPAEAAIDQGEGLASQAKPKRARKAPQPATAEAGETPKATRARKPKAEPVAEPTEPKKPTRRRTTAKSEE